MGLTSSGNLLTFFTDNACHDAHSKQRFCFVSMQSIVTRHVMPAAAAEARSVYNQVLSRQLLAELAHLQELRDAAPMMTADEQLSHIRGLTVKQLISNPMSRLEVKLHPEQLQAVTTPVDDMMASIDGPAPHIVKGLDQKRAVSFPARSCCAATRVFPPCCVIVVWERVV